MHNMQNIQDQRMYKYTHLLMTNLGKKSEFHGIDPFWDIHAQWTSKNLHINHEINQNGD